MGAPLPLPIPLLLRAHVLHPTFMFCPKQSGAIRTRHVEKFLFLSRQMNESEEQRSAIVYRGLPRWHLKQTTTASF
jgi:hypothetical protein